MTTLSSLLPHHHHQILPGESEIIILLSIVVQRMKQMASYVLHEVYNHQYMLMNNLSFEI